MKGLIVKPYWGNKILKGEKIWEIRGTNTTHRGQTEIIYSGSVIVMGMPILLTASNYLRPNSISAGMNIK